MSTLRPTAKPVPDLTAKKPTRRSATPITYPHFFRSILSVSRASRRLDRFSASSFRRLSASSAAVGSAALDFHFHATASAGESLYIIVDLQLVATVPTTQSDEVLCHFLPPRHRPF